MPTPSPDFEEILTSLNESLTVLFERIASLERKITDDGYVMEQEVRANSDKLNQISEQITTLISQISQLEGRID